MIMKNQRRNFINQGLKSLGNILIKKELSEVFDQDQEKIKMLTQDGRLVEIDPKIINKRQKASNKDILNWIDQNHSTK